MRSHDSAPVSGNKTEAAAASPGLGAQETPSTEEETPLLDRHRTPAATSSGAPGEPPPPPGGRSRFGPGVPLPAALAGRMSSRLGAPLPPVWLHTGAAAGRTARSVGAQAFTLGPHVAFAPGAYAPGTPVGDGLLAHELSHVVQQRGQTGGGQRGAAEHEADRVAVETALGLPLSEPLRVREGLAMRRCSDGPPVGTVDWRGNARETYDAEASRIRTDMAELRTLRAKETLTSQDEARIQEIEARQDQAVSALRRLGIRVDNVRLFQAIMGNEDLLRLHGSIRGAQSPMMFGERRQVEAALDWVPQGVDVRVSWSFDANGGPVEPLAEGGSGVFHTELGESFWWKYEMAEGARRRNAGRQPQGPAELRLWAKVQVGNAGDTQLTLESSIVQVERRTPDTIVPIAPEILTLNAMELRSFEGRDDPQQPPADLGLPSRDGLGAPQQGAGPTGPPLSTPRVDSDLVMVDTPIHFELSWVPPLGFLRGDTGYDVGWGTSSAANPLGPSQMESLVTERAGGGRTFGRQRQHSESFSEPGEYIVYAVIAPVTLSQSYGNLPITDTPLIGARRLRAVDTQTMGEVVLDRHRRTMEQRTYASHMDTLSQQIAQTEATLAGGSIAPDELQRHHQALTTHQAEMTRVLGTPDRTASFPEADSGFQRDQVYVAPVAAAYAHQQLGGAQPLSTYLRIAWTGTAWEAKVVDATTKDVLTASGSGESPWHAARAALTDWSGNNDFPTGGRVVYTFDKYGWGLNGSFSTTSTSKTLLEWVDRILLAGAAVVGVALLLMPDPTGATKVAGAGILKGVGMGLMIAGVLRGSYAIYRNLELGRPLLSEANALEAVGILASLVGLRGTQVIGGAQRGLEAGLSASRVAAQMRVGGQLIALSMAADIGTFVYVSEVALSQLHALSEDASIPEGDKQRRMLMLIGQLALQGLLVVGSNRQLFSRPRAGGGFEPGFVDRLVAQGANVELDPVNRTRIELELRRRGIPAEEIATSDAELVRQLTLMQEAQAPRVGQAGGAYGYGVHGVHDPSQRFDPSTLSGKLRQAWARNLLHGASFKRSHHTTSGNIANGTITVPAGGGQPKTVAVRIVAYGGDTTTTAPAAPSGHDRPGPARAELNQRADGSYEAVIYIHRNLSDTSAQAVIAHELNEVAGIVHGYHRSGGTGDFAAYRDNQQQAGVFRRGSTLAGAGDVTGHDQGAARELQRFYEELGLPGAKQAYDDAVGDVRTRTATNVPPAVEARYTDLTSRFDVMLREFGFGTTTLHETRTQRLAEILGVPVGDPLIQHVLAYRARQSARGRAAYYQTTGFQTLAARLGITQPTESMVTAELIEHLIQALPRTGGAFTSSGVSGGHTTDALRTLQAMTPAPGGGSLYEFVPIPGESGSIGTGTFQRHAQFLWTQPGAPPSRPTAAHLTGPPPAGWIRANGPKTTIDNTHAFLVELEDAVLRNSARYSTLPPGQHAFGPITSSTGARVGGSLRVTVDALGTRQMKIVAGWVE
jgi:hypothetical protein